jgi:hypothetical protein
LSDHFRCWEKIASGFVTGNQLLLHFTTNRNESSHCVNYYVTKYTFFLDLFANQCPD